MKRAILVSPISTSFAPFFPCDSAFSPFSFHYPSLLIRLGCIQSQLLTYRPHFSSRCNNSLSPTFTLLLVSLSAQVIATLLEGSLQLTSIPVSKEEPSWESFSEDENPPEPPKASRKPITAASAAGSGKASKKSTAGGSQKQGQLGSFFKKK